MAKRLRKKEAEFKKERAINKYSVGNIVTEMVEKIVPMSISNNIIDILIYSSVRQDEGALERNVDDDQLKDDIKMKMEEEDRAKRQDALSKARTKRLELKEEKVKLWKEKAKMMNLIKEMDDLRLETFDREWDEHDLLDGWMLEILASGLVDDDVEMFNVEGMIDMNEMMLVDDYDIKKNDGGEDEMETSQLDKKDDEDGIEDAEIYEDWLDDELSFMMVDEEI